MAFREFLPLLILAMAVVAVFLWLQLKYRLPLKRLLSALDLGMESSQAEGGKLVRRLQRRCVDFDTIFQIQQAELDRSQVDFELLLNSLELFVGYFSQSFAVQYINRYGRGRLDILDRPAEELQLGRLLDSAFLSRIWKKLRRQGHVLGLEGKVSLPHEGERDIRLSVIPVDRTQTGGKGYMVLAEDVSRQRRVELNLQNQIALSQHIFDAIPEFILVVDNNMNILFANGSLTRYTGFEKMLGRPIQTILSVQAQADGFDEYLRNVLQNQQPVNRINIVNPIGAGNNFVDLLIKPLHRGRRRIGALIIVRDVTEWREMTDEIRSLQTFTDKVINASPYALLSIDSRDNISVWNQSAEQLFSRKAQQVIGMELFLAAPELRPYQDLINEVKIIGRAQFQPEQELVIGGQPRLVNMNFYPIYNNGTNVVVSIEDITTVRVLQKSLSEAQKMGALGMLTRGIVHDLNNMLTGILGRASILKKKIPPESDLQKDVEIIAQSGERVSELISRIHQFSRQRMDREKPVCINQVVRQTLELLRPNLKGVTVSLKEENKELWVAMDQTKISQIVVNLVVNARDAMRNVKGPELNIEIAPRQIRDHERLMDGDYVELRFVDNGIGIAPEHLGKIFEPFFSTKAEENGTGIGLATVHTLVTEASGIIDVSSLSGKGSVFALLLPLKEPRSFVETPVTERGESPQPLIPGLVLLVDDEAVVRDIGAEMLQTLGLEVQTAPNGEEGVRLFSQHRDRIRLVLLDVEMPGMGGEETFEKLREAGCDCPVVISSGYNRDYLERQVFTRRLEYYLPKPFQLSQISELLKELARNESKGLYGGHHVQ